jgi:hypothetical protein
MVINIFSIILFHDGLTGSKTQIAGPARVLRVRSGTLNWSGNPHHMEISIDGAQHLGARLQMRHNLNAADRSEQWAKQGQ